MTTLDSLLEADDAIADWIVRVHPTTEDEVRKMREALALRTQLDRTINALVARQLQLSAQRLAAEAQAIAQATEQLKSVAKHIDQVQQVISIGGTVLALASKVLSSVT
jgi:hypothetical protein